MSIPFFEKMFRVPGATKNTFNQFFTKKSDVKSGKTMTPSTSGKCCGNFGVCNIESHSKFHGLTLDFQTGKVEPAKIQSNW